MGSPVLTGPSVATTCVSFVLNINIRRTAATRVDSEPHENSPSCRRAPVIPSKSAPPRKRSTASAIGRSCCVT